MTETPSGYVLHQGTPRLADYIRLRADSGLTPRTYEQAAPALLGSWAACHVIETATGETVGMGRLIGDGGWCFHVVDMAVLPLHQRRGIGNSVLTWLLDQIRSSAPPDAFVSLMADPPGRRLYAKHGFTERRDLSIGMALWLGRDDAGAEAAVLPSETPFPR